ILLDDGTRYGTGNFVVFNIMDDDVVTNTGDSNLNRPVTCMKERFKSAKKLEYVYLRLDTIAIQRSNFSDCTSLKYINLEDLTELRRIGDSTHFNNCTSLFAGQILDLSRTKLFSIDGGGTFNNVPLKGIILPSTLTTISSWTFQGTAIESIVWPTGLNKIEGSMFKNNTALKEIYLSSSVASIGQDAFLSVNTLEKVFFVGTLDELNTLLATVNTSGNAPFFDVVGENNANLISYDEYLALEDKGGKYVVYNYSWCDAYNNGNHEITGTNPCVGYCSVCERNIVKHSENAETTYTVEYADFSMAGSKITACTNEGCTYKVTEALPALFKNHGYSAPENGEGGIDIKITINHDAVKSYEELTGKSLSYGLFIVTKKLVGDGDIIDANGKIADGGYMVEMPKGRFDIMTMKLTGFTTDAQKALEFAFGAYVLGGEAPAFVQAGEKAEGDKYVFTSFNDIVAIVNESNS
ncbi:MAG: leucine-rich repeat domain-containing protein, partial [Clostridia bacterium]|nr:leucine-rich repeat domain-containing protein [Clostridia bacterium]